MPRLPVLLPLLVLSAGLSACAINHPAAIQGTSTSEWVIDAAPARVQEAFRAARDSIGFRPLRLTDSEVSMETGRPVVRLRGHNGFGTVTVEILDEGPTSTRTRLRMVYPLPFERETPMMHLRWGFEAIRHLGASTRLANVPEAVLPAPRASCEGAVQVTPMPGVIGPSLVSGAEPDYTKKAQSRRYEGRVQILAAVDEAGRVVCAEVASGLPYGLSASALRAVLSWQFRPATLDGRPVPE